MAARFMPSDYIIGLASPSEWAIPIATLSTTIVLVLALALLFLAPIQTMGHGTASPFPFQQLPPELRDMVYERLVEDPCYPPPSPCGTYPGSPLSWVLPGRWPSRPAPATPEQARKPSNWIMLANKQIYAEYMDVVCKKGTFHLTVSPQNYTAPISPTVPPKKIWNIAPHTLRQLRQCDIKMITTSNMLGVADPRNMKPEDWALARQMRQELKEVDKVHELNLHVKAIGDPLWNPLWVWYHASQSLKTMGSTVDDNGPTGPQLNRITFSLDTWSPGENYLHRERDSGNHWAWRCMKGHYVGPDSGADMTVREFCARLYMDCRTCRPELDSDDEMEDD